MAEQEVIKHTKKVYSIWSSKDHSFWHKLKEFFLEIAIIVFAVSLSIWFHDINEKKHKQHDVEQFMKGLHEDLHADIKEMEDDRDSFLKQHQAFVYLTHIEKNVPLNKDSLKKYLPSAFQIVGFSPNNGRFEGFKSSGKIGDIEDTKLQNDVMDFYQENVPVLILTTNFYNSRKEKLFDYIEKNKKNLEPNRTNLVELLGENVPQNLCSELINVNEILNRYDLCINNAKLIQKEIRQSTN